MITIFNIRGTNGSGKSTLVRHLLGPDFLVESVPYPEVETKRTKFEASLSPVSCHISSPICALGDYRKKTPGMDEFPCFQVCFATLNELIKRACLYRNDFCSPDNIYILCEGVLASTVYGSWGDFAREIKDNSNNTGVDFQVVHLPVAIELARERILRRNGGKEVKWDQVEDKIKAVQSACDKFERDGIKVHTFSPDTAEQGMRDLMRVQIPITV